MIYSKKDFEKQMQALSFKGFDIKSEIQGYSWKRRIDNRINQIIVGYKSYPGSFYMQTPFVSILLIDIENILKKYCEKSGIKQDYFQYTVQAQLGNLRDVNYKIFDTDIHDEASFHLVANEVKKIIDSEAFPFFEKYNSLNNVAELLSDKKPEEIVPYVQGPILLPKTVLILREAGHPQYKKKLGEFYLLLNQYAEKKENYKPFLSVFIDLFSEDLRTIK